MARARSVKKREGGGRVLRPVPGPQDGTVHNIVARTIVAVLSVP